VSAVPEVVGIKDISQCLRSRLSTARNAADLTVWVSRVKNCRKSSDLGKHSLFGNTSDAFVVRANGDVERRADHVIITIAIVLECVTRSNREWNDCGRSEEGSASYRLMRELHWF
jgi:hypothetical protein